MKRSFASRDSAKRPARPSPQWPAWRRVALWLCCGALIGGARAQDGNSPNTAYQLGNLTSTVTRTGRVDNASPADFYQFEIPVGPVREVVAYIPALSLSSSVEVSLARDANGDGIEDVLVSDTGSGPPGFGARDAVVSLWLDPGTYFVRVKQGGVNASTAYRLTLSQTNRPASPGNNDNSRATARTLSAGQPITDFVGTNDCVDYYRFVVTNQVTAVTGRVAAASLSAGVTLSLLRDDDVLVSDNGAGPPGFGASDAEVWLWLDPGTYYLRVEAANAFNNTTYAVNLLQSPRPGSPGTNDNSTATARVFTPGQPLSDFVGVNDVADYYKFVVTALSTDVTALVPSDMLWAAIELCLLDGNGAVIACDDGTGQSFADNAFLFATLTPGTYYVRVASGGAGHNTTYLLGISGPPPPPSPGIGLSGDLAFGNVVVGSNATRTLTIRNTGTATLNVSGITYPAGFSGSFSGAIATGGLQEVTVTFAPTSAGDHGGTVSVGSDAGTGVNTIAISGRGATRIIVLGGPVNFGNVESLQRSNRNLSIQNQGNAPLTVSGLTFPEGFSGSYTGAIPANGSVNVVVTFAPAAVTNYSGTVEVASDQTGGTNTATVSGAGTAVKTRIIGLSGNLNFGGVEILRSSNRVLVITNSGQAPFTVSGITYPVGFSGNFTGGVFLVRGWRNVTVTFSPLDTNTTYGGSVIVNSPDTNGGINTIQASGTGTPILPRVIELGGDLAFGDVQTYQSATRLLLITNSGVAPMLVSSISYPTGFSGAFSGVIRAGGSTNVKVKFAPPAPGGYNGELEVHADDNAGASTRAVSGTGTPAPLRPVAGNYQGVFHQIDAVRHESSGFFTLTAPGKKGEKYRASYSAKILLAGQELSASGKFDFDGHATNVIKRKGKDTIRVEWHADPQGGDEITGMIIAPSWEAALVGRRAVFAAKTNDAPQEGTYTMIFAGIPGADASPQGDGFGTVSVSERGVITLAGTLADGTKVTQSANLSQQGDWPLYVNLYKGRGSLLGKLIFASSIEEDLGGRASWIRPAIAKSIYPDGFEVDSETTGSRYLAPAGKTNRVVAITNAIVAFTGGNLSPALECAALLTAGNKVSNASPHTLKMTITKSSGLFSGSLMLNGTKKEILFQGVFLQRTNPAGYGAGYFLREKLSGRVEFRAAP